MKTLVKYFLRGLYILTPIGLTVYILYWIFTAIDGMLNLSIPGLGFLLTITTVTLIGFIASNFLTATIIQSIEKIFRKLPFVKLLYTSIKDLMEAFVGSKKKFDKPVLVRITESNGHALGFITRESMRELYKPGMTAVYFPQSYNFAGQVLIFPKDKIELLNASSTDVMAFIVSGGVSGFSIV